MFWYISLNILHRSYITNILHEAFCWTAVRCAKTLRPDRWSAAPPVKNCSTPAERQLPSPLLGFNGNTNYSRVKQKSRNRGTGIAPSLSNFFPVWVLEESIAEWSADFFDCGHGLEQRREVRRSACRRPELAGVERWIPVWVAVLTSKLLFLLA